MKTLYSGVKLVNTKVTCLFIILALVLGACKKHAESGNFPKLLYWKSAEKKGAFRVFANGGEVTDQAVINRQFSSFYYRNFFHQTLNVDTTVTMNFVSETSVDWNADYLSPAHPHYLSVIKDDDRFLFSYPNRLKPITDGTPNFELSLGMLKYPYIITGPEPTITEKRIAYGDYTMLKVPGFDFLLHRSSSGLYLYDFAFNEFNEGVITKLGMKDTLWIQEYVYTYQVK